LTAAGIGGFVAAPLLNNIITKAGGNWRMGWYFVTGICILSALLSALWVRGKPSDLGQQPDGVKMNPSSPEKKADSSHSNGIYRSIVDWKVAEALRSSVLYVLLLVGVGFLIPFAVCIAHGVLHLRDIGHTPEVAAMSVGVLTLFSVLGRLLGGALGDRIEPRYPFMAALTLMGIGCLVLSTADSRLTAYLYAIFLGMGFGAGLVCQSTIIGNYFGANAFASIQAISFPVSTAVGAVAPFLVGLGYDRTGSYGMGLVGSAVAAFIAAAALLLALPPKPPNRVLEKR
jgi:sugar phosphate permease